MGIHEKFGKGVHILSPNDKIFTPRPIAKMVIDTLPVDFNGKSILDPSAGDGAFYDQYPEGSTKDWAELDRGRDFFEVNKHYDWIITNPPYSIYDEFMTKAMEVADNIVFLVPLNKVVSSQRRLKQIRDYGGVVQELIIGSGKCGFPFGFPAVAIWIQKGYKGKLYRAWLEEEYENLKQERLDI